MTTSNIKDLQEFKIKIKNTLRKIGKLHVNLCLAGQAFTCYYFKKFK